MNKTSVLMLFIGAILGIVIGYVMFSEKPEFNIQAEGFRKINYENKEFNFEVVKRIDADNVEVVKKIHVPASGFLKGYSAIQQLVDKLVEQGVLAKSPGDAASETPQE